MSKLKTSGEPAEECGGTALGKEVSRIQLHECRHTQTANRAESGGPVQGADTGTDEPEPRCEHRKNGRGTIPLSTGMDRLFRQVWGNRHRCWPVLSSGSGADSGLRSGNNGSGARHGFARVTPSGCERRPGRSNGGQRSWSLAAGGLARAQHRIAQCLLRLARDSAIDCETHSLTPPNRRMRTQHVRWCGRRGAAKLPPIPMCAEHVRQLEGESPFHNLMEVK